MTTIHPTALVSSSAQLGAQVTIGPFAVIEAGTVIGDRCTIAARTVVKEGTEMGDDNQIFEGAVIGGRPQHIQAGQKVGSLRIGHRNVIRESVTIHRAFKESACTIVGNENMLMVNAHIAHDCIVGDRTIMANNVMLAGHVTVQDRAFLSGAVGVHQFCRIGTLAMIGGQGRVMQDVPPYVTVDGIANRAVGLNSIGMRRAGIPPNERTQVKKAYRVLYHSGLPWNDVLEALRTQFVSGPAQLIAQFVAQPGRGIIQERRSRAATLRLADYRGESANSVENSGEQADDRKVG